MPQLIKDFKGNLIPKAKARRIKNEAGKHEYFEEGTSCILMPDGKWYRTTTGKILYDWSAEKWAFCAEFTGLKGLVPDGSFGCYSDSSKSVPIKFKKEAFSRKSVFDPFSKNLESQEFLGSAWKDSFAMNEQTALKHGYVESIGNGIFYKESDCTEEDLKRNKTPAIPPGERTNTYSLDDDKDYRIVLEEAYEANKLTIPTKLKSFARRYIPFSFGLEWEVQNGHLPKRVREPFGVRACRDGSLGDGIEYVSVPMVGAKGLLTAKYISDELTKRCTLSNKCSIHVHFGGVRRDKLFVVSLWSLLCKIQNEFVKYFPFSRTNLMENSTKIYANLLPDLSLNTDTLLDIDSDAKFKKALVKEFNKIYMWLNCGHPLGEKYDEEFVKETKEQLINGKPQEFYCYRVKKYSFTTKLPRHAIQGRKWERHTRYMFCNFLNLFFAHSRTVEARIHEATTNFDKIFNYMCVWVAIIKYAENFRECLSTQKITISDVLVDHFPPKIVKAIVAYLDERKATFCTMAGSYRTNWKEIENGWLNQDKNYKAPKLYEI